MVVAVMSARVSSFTNPSPSASIPIPRTVVAYDYHNGVGAGTIKRAITVAENYGPVHGPNESGGGMSGKRGGAIIGCNRTGRVKDQCLSRNDPPHAIHITGHQSRRMDYASNPVVVAYQLSIPNGHPRQGQCLHRSEVVVGCIRILCI